MRATASSAKSDGTGGYDEVQHCWWRRYCAVRNSTFLKGQGYDASNAEFNNGLVTVGYRRLACRAIPSVRWLGAGMAVGGVANVDRSGGRRRRAIGPCRPQNGAGSRSIRSGAACPKETTMFVWRAAIPPSPWSGTNKVRSGEDRSPHRLAKFRHWVQIPGGGGARPASIR